MERKMDIIKKIQRSLEVPGLVNTFLYLEDLFDNDPAGFYKFSSPCKSPFYEPGTSIAEETGWPSITISSRLGKLCATYKSTSSYNETLAFLGQEGVFEGKPYLRYMDKRSYKTYFMRNQVVVEAIVAGVPLRIASGLRKMNMDVPKSKWMENSEHLHVA